jgi:hypothetical protein
MPRLTPVEKAALAVWADRRATLLEVDRLDDDRVKGALLSNDSLDRIAIDRLIGSLDALTGDRFLRVLVAIARHPAARRKGTVYFMSADGAGRVKIGWTQRVGDAESRRLDLQVGCPFPLRPLLTMPSPVTVERRLHFHFRECRTGGEWFDGDVLEPFARTLGALIEREELARHRRALASFWPDDQFESEYRRNAQSE